MTYHIEHAPIGDETECHRQALDYTNLPVVNEIARLLSHFDPFQIYWVMDSKGLVLSAYWYGKEDTVHAYPRKSA